MVAGSLDTRIQQAAAKNKELLRILAETDHAAPALAQQNRLVADLQTELAESDRRVQEMDRRRLKEFKEHEKYRDSIMRRFAYKATGQRAKFEAKAEKEEKEYFEALQLEHREKEMNGNLREQLAAAQQVVRDLAAQVDRHAAAQQELDRLYDSVFSGPTPEMPEEDERERVMTAAAQAYQDVRGRAEAEAMALSQLGDAQRRMGTAMNCMQDALSASRADMFGGGTFTDLMERNALQRAETEIQAARMSVLQARRLSPKVPELPMPNINHGNLMRDVFFDNIFTDMAFHDEIKASAARVDRAATFLNGAVAEAEARHRDLDAELGRKEKELRDARSALQKLRETAFESTNKA